MSPPQVSGLVAMGMPQQKEACVWGAGGGEKRRREGAFSCAMLSGLHPEEKNQMVKTETRSLWFLN